MNVRRIAYLLLCASLLYSIMLPGYAAETSGRTDVFYDSGRDVIYATASSNPDYNTQYYYTIRIRTYLTKMGTAQSLDAWGYAPGEFGAGTTYIETPAEAGVDYLAMTYYQGVVEYQTYEVVPGCGGCFDWYDIYGYLSIIQTGDPEIWGPTYSVWVWSPPMIVMRTVQEVFGLARAAEGSGLRVSQKTST